MPYVYTMTKPNTPRKNFHVVVDGERIASFLLVEDATFFAGAAFEAGMFPKGTRPIVEDQRGHRHEYSTASTPLS